jgi:hypothetical protein
MGEKKQPTLHELVCIMANAPMIPIQNFQPDVKTESLNIRSESGSGEQHGRQLKKMRARGTSAAPLSCLAQMYTTREATPADVNALGSLLRACMLETYRVDWRGSDVSHARTPTA